MIIGKWYDYLKWFAKIGLPALIALFDAVVLALMPYVGDQSILIGVVSAIGSALVVFLNVVLGLSKTRFYREADLSNPALPVEEI
ncbi:MAG: phage holin [Bifidobacteriaceae bacterium]|jgi:hypothetical protein|nr:phage holin [Bifidobacteriaceae bacterium]